MSYFDDASLVMIPSGYKDQKVYSVKPLDGSGDLTFSRASSATRVASNGLIEKVRTNLSTYSEDFANAAWSPSDITVTSNTQLAPNGTTTADVVMEGTGTAQHRFQKTLSLSSSFYTFSVYAKNISGTRQAYIDLGPLAAYFTFSTETIYTPTGLASVQNVGSGWYRITLSNLTAISISSIYLGLATGNSETYTGNGTSSIAFWGAQVETGDIATDYIATTTAAVSVGPVSGLPRLDYLGSTCPRLLLEPQRSNIATYSEQFDNPAGWTLFNGTQVANTTETLDPAGYYGAEKVIMGATDSATYRKSIGGLTDGDTYTLSLYIKQGSGVTAFLDICDASTTVDITPTSQWVRYTKTGVWNTSLNFIDLEFRGTAGAYCYIWGAQLEAGAYATSYIPTLGTSVTRVGDAIYDESASALIGQTEGTLFVQFKANTSGNNGASRFSISSGTTANWIFVGTESNSIRGYVRANTSVIFSDSTVALTGNDKIALAYKSGSIALYINGTQVATNSDAFTFSATLDDISTGVGGSYTVDETVLVNQMLVFPTRLTNAQLAELTA
jgi:hypothetical protein